MPPSFHRPDDTCSLRIFRRRLDTAVSAKAAGLSNQAISSNGFGSSRWRDHGGEVDASVIRGLYETADRGGIDRARHLALGELWIDGSVKDASTRIWPQTERMKAALVMARLWPNERALYETAAIDAWAGMQLFILPKNCGLFRDKLRADGSFVAEGALASSLYHIVCAISELVRYVDNKVRQ